MNFLQDKTIQTIIIVAIVIIVIYFLFLKKNKEGFEQPGIPLERVMSDENIVIPPTYIQSDGTIMSGPDFGIPNEIIPSWGISDRINIGETGDNFDNDLGLSTALCSPSCCSQQYPTPFPLEPDRFVCGNKDEFVPNNYVCNNSWQNSGCLCMTKDQAKWLGNRGGNA